MFKKLLLLIVLFSIFSPSAFAQALGTIKTIAGGVPNNIPATSVGIGISTAVLKDSSGNVYVAVETTAGVGGAVFKIDSTGNLTTVAGNLTVDYALGFVANGDGGLATNASLSVINGLAIDGNQNLYLSDFLRNTIRKVTASTGIITTIAGGGTGCSTSTDPAGDGCPATSAILSFPYQLFVDANQNLYIADSGNNRIREVVASTGNIRTVAGGGTVCTAALDSVGDGCLATSATLHTPSGVFLDSHNNIFISDSGNFRVREVPASTGIIQSIAGTGTHGYNGDSIPATTAQINDPLGLFVSSAGNVFFSDLGNSRVREIVASSGLIQTVAGGGGGGGCSGETDIYGDGCPATQAIVFPNDVFVDGSNNIFVADASNFRVREVGGSTGIIQTFAGNGTGSYSGDGLLATNAELATPFDVVTDSSGNVYIADSVNLRVRKVNATTGIITTIAGGDISGSGCTAQTDAYGDGCPATQALLLPIAVALDRSGNLFISDNYSGRIREVSATTGIISTVAGGGNGCPNQTDTVGDNCPAADAMLSFPWGLFVDDNGNIFFSDFEHFRIREVVAATGLIQSIAGTGDPLNHYNGDNIPAVQAQISNPTGLSGDALGNIYFSDAANFRIREIVASTHNIVTVAGIGKPGYNGDNILATQAQVDFPYGIFSDRSGNLFFGDQVNGRVREVVASTGLIQSVAGNGTIGFSGDGGPANSAELAFPEGVSTDPSGNLFIADTFNNRIREVFGVVPGNTFTITTTALASGNVGTPYPFGLQATGGVAPYTWSLASGSLPPGFSSITSAGVLSGTPTTTGTFNFTVKAMDSAANVQTQALSLTINPAIVTLVTISVTPTNPSIVAGATQQFTATGHYSDGSTQNLTSTAIWSSLSLSIATISTSGLATGVNVGSTTITATVGSIPGSTLLTVTSAPVLIPLTVKPIGTGNGTVTDNFERINCTTTAGVQSGTCSANYNSGTVVTLTATPSSPSTFAGWGSPCSGTGSCSVTMTAPQIVTASFTPPPQMINLNFTPGSNQSAMATYDCPSNPAPSPSNPCTDPNAHALAFAVPQILQPFSVTVQASEVPPSNADGVCENGATPSTDFDCRFVSFFTYQTLANGNKIVPLCFPYANGNCVHYLVFSGTPGVEPNPSFYVGPIDWTISFNNDKFIPPAPYTGSTPHLYDDPDYAVSPTSPFGTNCSTPMLVGNPPVATNPPIFCQFEFDITTGFDPNKKVDTAVSGRSKQFNDVGVAFPPANVGNLTVTTSPSSGTVIAGNPLSFIITVTNSAGGAVTGATLSDPLPAGTNVSWSISPAYSGPGSCTITGASGSQVLNCVFGTIAASQTFNISLLSSNSSIGTYANTAVVQIGNQQILTIGAIIVQAVPVAFSGLTASQSIQAGTASITLGGTIGSGTAHPASGETVSILINGATHNATIGSNGSFTTSFPTLTFPASTSPYLITYSFAGDSIFSAATNNSTSLTVLGASGPIPLTVKPIGTGNGAVTDNLEQINCTTTAGVQSGTCSANYNSGTVVTLTATPSSPSAFAGWGSPCSGTVGCSVTMNSPETVTASFTPPPQMITLSFTPGSNQSAMATYDCPSNPAPSPSNPCTDPNAHALAFAVPQILQPFSVTVQASEVPPSNADGVCENGATPSTDFDCRFVTFFTYQTLANGNKIVPLCFPYANGNCVHYLVFSGTPGVEPNPSFYVGPIDWTISFNNDKFIPPAPYTGSTPRLYDDPDYAVSPTSPFGTNCSTPMLVGNPPVATNPPIFCQFEFDITTGFDPNKKVDTAISGRSRQFNDVVVAFPPANVGNLTITTTTTPSTGIVTAGSPLNLTITVTNSAGGAVTGATLSDPLPAGANVSWSISPAYTGPGTCAITGAIGTQVLNCSFATIAASQTFSISLLSANSSLGKYTNAAVIQIGNQQILTIGSIIVTIPGDVNGDGVVNCADLDIVKASFNKKAGQPGFDPRADVNHDGIVNIYDLAYVARQLPAGTTCQ